MERLLKLLQSIYPLSPDLVEHISKVLKTKEIAKKDFLLKAGHVSRNIYFIEKGLLRCFYYLRQQEISAWFMKEGDFVISVNSFFNQKPSKETIQALEDCELYYISYADLQYIYRTFMEFNFVGRVLTEKYYTLSEERLEFMRAQKAKVRYEYMLNNYPDLIQRIPDKFMASYLGITAIRLCNIRGMK